MVMFIYLCQFNSSFSFEVFALDADLFAEEEQEYVDVATHRCQMQVRIAFRVLLVQTVAPFRQLLDCLVATVKNSKSHQRLLSFIVILPLEEREQTHGLEMLEQFELVVNDCIVQREEVSFIFFIEIRFLLQ